jgi:hypothetical protein
LAAGFIRRSCLYLLNKRVRFLNRIAPINPAAGLNFGDCFAYACAHMPLLYKGDDFPHTDIEVA